jgi:hypothetical protein
MKRVRCPKCDEFITFDETKYQSGQSLVFQCPYCNKQFGIRIGVSKLKKTQQEEDFSEEKEQAKYGSIVVIENGYHFKQIIPLRMGDNVIGRRIKGNDINCAIESGDLNIDLTHCYITVSKDKKGRLKYVLRDGPSYGGTFVNFERLDPRERRVIEDGTVFTIGESSVILKGPDINTD